MTTQTTPKHHIRWQIKRDIPEIVALLSAAYGRPLTESELLTPLRERCTIGMVLEDYRGGEPAAVVGAMIYELSADRLHVLYLGVHPAEQGLGFGTAMLDRLIVKLTTHHRRNRLSVDVLDDDTAALLWLQKRGWRAVECIDGCLVRMEWRK